MAFAASGAWLPAVGAGLSLGLALLARANYVTSALQTVKKLPSAANAHQTHLDGVLSAQTLKLLNEATDDKKRWSIVFASPEFQLK